MAKSKSLPTKVDFEVKQGDTFKRALTHTLEGVAVDMSDVVPVFIFNSDTVENLTLGSGLTWGGDDNEILYISQLIDWAGTLTYELEYTYTSGEVSTKIAGKIKSVAEIDE